MIVCITSSGKTTDGILDPRFGRCAYFAICDLETGGIEILENEAGASGGGAGISSGQLMVEKSIEAVITGNVGPNAMNVLSAAKIAIYRGEPLSVNENIGKFKNGELAKINETVPSHFGMGGRS
ncbi:MAG: dinitrogenase iron-molybdenum cofactor biosynthesis protein [Clostridiales bacterium GWF2_38_85]|nr:MAG: dinitrogenase iron-molybdenum cofactor biosynthesis protein [Clostridiales bacterium GWF2_38_85]HBL84524.1 dinitrogenase iron-molybdenum cofactor biosynthesis protein [Clostridiales bacterium]